ncbi:MAG: metalloregulator ArsR/SmtB family transcription factor [Alphaproteobacteria bacterium]|nr:metalloregulator ArsR/SmtB family transcription factor [Alphaproteobacteria bacterium]
MDTLLKGLRAAAEPTRLRLLALCAHGELTVSELTQILAQSQPRVSRHLKLLAEAGLLDRFQEGTHAFFRLAESGTTAEFARVLVDSIPADDRLLALDLERLEAIKKTRAEAAAAYFRENAARWDKIRSLYVDEAEVERVVIDRLSEQPIDDLLDIGTGTARILELLGDRVQRGVGIDQSREMIAVARANLEAAGLRNCVVRHGDMYQLPWPSAAFDAVTLHLVLHYAEVPADAIAEAARVLRPGGRLVIVDFAPHEVESLRDEHAHRRLGFADDEVEAWYGKAGLATKDITHLKGDPLTVSVWSAGRPAGRAPRSRERLQ